MAEGLGRNVNRDQADKAAAMTQHDGATVRAGDLFGSTNIFTRASLTNLKRRIGLQVFLLFLFFASLVLYCIVLYCTVLYCTVLYCTVLYCTVLYCIVLYCIVLYCIVLYCIVLYCFLASIYLLC